MTTYWLVWDGAARWIVDGLDARGLLPQVRRLQRAGARAAARPPVPNCQTPPSLATLFTGTGPAEHGVTGFDIPDPERFGAAAKAFTAAACRVPPVWERLAVRSAFVHVPWVFDDDGTVGGHVEAAVEAYSGRVDRHAAYPADASPLPGGLGERWTEVGLGDGLGCHVRTVSAPDGELVLRTGIWRSRVAGADRALTDRLRALPPFAGEAAGSLYRQGRFGPTLPEGGDGQAEEVLLSSLEPVVCSFGAAADLVLAHHRADLVVIYLPMTDDIGHELAGWADERGPGHRPELAEAAWRLLGRCYGASDAILGRVLDRAGPEDTVLLTADHGMAAVTHEVYPNAILAAAGLAVPDGRGGVDAERSAVLYHPAGNGSLWAHPHLPGADLHRAVDALRAVIGPHGAPVLAAVTDAHGRELPDLAPLPDDAPGRGLPHTAPARSGSHHRALPPGLAAGHVFCHFDDGLLPRTGIPAGGGHLARTAKSGGHVTNLGDPRLDAVFAASGPAFTPGADLGRIDNTQVAAMVEHALTTAPAGAGR